MNFKPLQRNPQTLYLTLEENRMIAPAPAIRSCDTFQPIPCFDSCKLTIICMSIIKLSARVQAPTLARKFDISHWFPFGAGGRAVITKICRMDRLPNLLIEVSDSTCAWSAAKNSGVSPVEQENDESTKPNQINPRIEKGSKTSVSFVLRV